MKGEFSVDGKAHRILSRLYCGPATLSEIAEVIRGPQQTLKGARGRAYQFLVSLRDEGLASTKGEVSFITGAGTEALRDLDYGHPYDRDIRRKPQSSEGATA